MFISLTGHFNEKNSKLNRTVRSFPIPVQERGINPIYITNLFSCGPVDIFAASIFNVGHCLCFILLIFFFAIPPTIFYNAIANLTVMHDAYLMRTPIEPSITIVIPWRLSFATHKRVFFNL